MSTPLNDTNFADEVLNEDLPVVVLFGASWCQPCKALEPALTQLTEHYAGRVKVVKADVELAAKAAQANSVRGVPTLLAFNRGEVTAMASGGINPGRFKEFVERQVAV